MRPRFLIAILFALAAFAGLSACGVKGPLEPPASVNTDSSPTGAGTPGTAPKEEKHRPFVLDGLL